MATVSLIDPYSQQAEEIARRKRMAQALQEQGSQVLEMPTTPGVLISPYAGLGKLLQAGIGAYKEKKARDDYTALQDKYRTNYNTQFGKLAQAISAPEIKGVQGQLAVDEIPAQMAPKIKQGFGGYGMPQEDGQYEVAPAIPGKAAIAPVEARPAGYISPDLLKEIDIPEVKQLLMAKYLAQFEPKDIKLGQGDTLYRQFGSGPLVEQAVGKAAAKAADRPIVLGAGQNAYDPTGKLIVTGPAKTETTPPSDLARLLTERAALAAKNPNDPNLATYDSLIAKNTQDQRLVFDQVKFEYEKGNPGFTLEKVRNADGSESVVAVNKGSAVARPVMGVDGKALTSAAPKTTPHYSEIENNGRVVIVDLSLPAKDRLANAQDKGPIRNNLEKITTTDASGREVTRYVDKTTLATLGDIPAPYKGFMSDLAEAGQLPANWQSIPQIAGLVRENLINKAGGITQADLASLKIRIAEAASRLAYEGVRGFNAAGLTPALPNFTTLQSQYPTASGAPAANAAAAKVTTQAEIAETAKRSGKSIEEVTRDAIAKGYKVQ